MSYKNLQNLVSCITGYEPGEPLSSRCDAYYECKSTKEKMQCVMDYAASTSHPELYAISNEEALLVVRVIDLIVIENSDAWQIFDDLELVTEDFDKFVI